MVIALSIVFLASSSSFAFGKGNLRERVRNHRIKNVIVLIPDGCDETVQTLARWYKGEDLQVDSMEGGGVMNHMANSVITGSAAAATAFSSGEKTTVRFLGVGPRTDDLLSIYQPEDMAPPYAPVATVLEAAESRGMSTGLVATSRITHATPAAFGCHIEDRGWDNDIMEHLVYNNIDVVFGGGARHLIPAGATYTTSFGEAWGGKRTDGEDLMQVLLDRGYQFVDNGTDMNALRSSKVWGLFDDSHMQPDIDRAHLHTNEPSLAEMTGKAIELLSQNPRGFFLMVEGSQVDWAGHANDAIYMTTDFLAFDEAVKVACDFADRDGRTLVLAYPDHNTGGMKLGHYNTAMEYTATTVEDLVEPLKSMQITSSGLVSMMTDLSDDAELISAVATWWGLDITDDVDEIRALEGSVGLAYALSRVVSKNHTVVGWTTHGHNAETVPLWVHGGQAPAGIIDNTMLAEMAADAMGVDLERLTNRLYLDLGAFTSDYEIEVSTDVYGQILDNGVVKVGGWELPISKDYMEKEGNRVQLPGLTVYASGDANLPEKVYVSKKALRVLGLL